MVAIALALVALARPQWGEDTQESFSQTREVMIALDLSRSMWTEDVGTSRLELARKTAADLLDSLKGESVGLIVFAGTAFVQVPLSPDYQIIREFMPSLDPDYMPQGGSDYRRMLEAALEGFGEANDRDRYLIVLSDGESSTQSWQNRLAELTKRDVHVVGIGIGTEKGGFINDQKGGYMADKNGDAILSRLQPGTLQTLANRTNGRYVNANALQTPRDFRALVRQTVETGRQGRVGNEATSLQTQRYRWFLLPAVIVGLLSLVREFQRRAKPQPVHMQTLLRRATLAAGMAFLAAFSLAPPVRAHFDSQAGFEVKEVFDSSPGQRLRAIADHLGKFGYDAYDLQLMIEATIKYGVDEKRQGNPPLEGVIRDAMEASRRGEQLNPKLAPWSYYRSQLAAVIAPNADDATNGQRSQNPKEANDEEDNGPMVIGQNTQHGGSDSYGEGAASKGDAALGDLSADDNVVPPHRDRKPKPPGSVRNATFMHSGGENGAAEDPILAFSRKNLAEIVKRDSPGRLHQMMAEDTQAHDNSEMDW
ncbi:MAG TPA: VWA domain-containing protein [Steroidobacteraceae bacterium]|nr:VWA domain-containing protein [Steroidobacteraceae bacterium]